MLGKCMSVRLQHRTESPRGEFLVAEALGFTFGFLARSNLDKLLENHPPHVLDGYAGEDYARVEVHVLFHSLVERRIGGDLENRSGLEPQTGAAARSEWD